MRNLMLVATLVLLVGSIGCTTVMNLGQTACEALVGGSQAEQVCAEIDKWRAVPEKEKASASEVDNP